MVSSSRFFQCTGLQFNVLHSSELSSGSIGGISNPNSSSTPFTFKLLLQRIHFRRPSIFVRHIRSGTSSCTASFGCNSIGHLSRRLACRSVRGYPSNIMRYFWFVLAILLAWIFSSRHCRTAALTSASSTNAPELRTFAICLFRDEFSRSISPTLIKDALIKRDVNRAPYVPCA